MKAEHRISRDPQDVERNDSNLNEFNIGGVQTDTDRAQHVGYQQHISARVELVEQFGAPERRCLPEHPERPGR